MEENKIYFINDKSKAKYVHYNVPGEKGKNPTNTLFFILTGRS